MASLDTYRAKRDFSATPEPEAKLVDAVTDRLAFGVQKHDASRLHYDFRLEWQGVLLSWAVTKGPSTDPAEKRLAVRTEDHPFSYGNFEGIIPTGNYGAGTVMLWDQGWWEPLHDPAEGLTSGKLHFRLHGARMKGGWALVRMRGKGRENWLLIKERDDEAGRSADALLRKHTRSVTSGRTMAAIAKGAAVLPDVEHSKPLPRFRKLQLAALREAPPKGDDWRHEAKFDGYRCLIAIGKGGVRLYTRNGLDWTEKFGALAAPAAALPCASALIDGEVISGDGGGNFSALQKALKSGGDLVFYAFDCLHLDGTDLTGKALSARREALETLLAKAPERGAIRLSPFIEGSGEDVFAAICEAGGEGIVSKRNDAPYRAGRGTSWIKTKCIRRAEFVVLGWSASDKPGRPFSSLLLGSFEKDGLIYRGRVGTGFDEAAFAELQTAMKALPRKTAPLEDVPTDAKRGAHWINPKLVAEVRYAEFTPDGLIRHGAYVGLREDKTAMTVSAKSEAETDLKVSGIRISSSDRVVFPDSGLTKGDVASYYEIVAKRMLAQLSRRPVSLLRCPDGTGSDCFFQKHAGKGFPDAVEEIDVEERSGETKKYMLINTGAGILGAVQMGTVEFHIWAARDDRLDRPDRMVFDLDPDEGLDFARVKTAAVEMRDALEGLGLGSGALVTGGKGIHVIVPLRRIAGWETVKTFAQTFATVFAQRYPDRFTATMSKAKRKDKIFIDWLRNERGATAIAPYSLRARKGAPVATPVRWSELETLKAADSFSINEVAERLSGSCPLDAVKPSGIGAKVVSRLEKWTEE